MCILQSEKHSSSATSSIFKAGETLILRRFSKIRIFVAELENIFQLCDDPETGFLKRVSDGISFCYTEGKSRHWLSEIRECDNILYYEIQFTEMLA